MNKIWLRTRKIGLDNKIDGNLMQGQLSREHNLIQSCVLLTVALKRNSYRGWKGSSRRNVL